VTVRTALLCLGLVFLPAALRAQDDIPALGKPLLSVPAINRARIVMVLGTQRPEQVPALIAATMDLEERFLAAAGAALTAEGLQGPCPTLATLAAANGLGIVPLAEVPVSVEPDPAKPVEKAEPLLAHMMQGIRDDKPLPLRWNQDQDEQRSFSMVLFEASRISAEAFRKGARTDLTCAHVFNHPSRYRGQVIHIQGTLRQLRRFDPPATAKAAGVADLYEGWIFDPQRLGADPWCVVFTELPSGVRTGEGLEYAVSFDGYFFKRYQYESRNTNKAEHWRRAPLLIGRTVTLTSAPVVAAPEQDWAGSLVPIFLGLVVSSIALAFGLGWWFRRGDRRVRQRVAAATERTFIEPEITMNEE
jgi:hypothetical protein